MYGKGMRGERYQCVGKGGRCQEAKDSKSCLAMTLRGVHDAHAHTDGFRVHQGIVPQIQQVQQEIVPQTTGHNRGTISLAELHTNPRHAAIAVHSAKSKNNKGIAIAIGT